MDFAERAARNEEVFRKVNERIEDGAEQHGVSGALPFHCECGRVACFETIEIPPARYEAIIQERYHFVAFPDMKSLGSNKSSRPNPTSSSSRRSARRAIRSTAITPSETTTPRVA